MRSVELVQVVWSVYWARIDCRGEGGDSGLRKPQHIHHRPLFLSIGVSHRVLCYCCIQDRPCSCSVLFPYIDWRFFATFDLRAADPIPRHTPPGHGHTAIVP